jgi:hypothetical protein
MKEGFSMEKQNINSFFTKGDPEERGNAGGQERYFFK